MMYWRLEIVNNSFPQWLWRPFEVIKETPKGVWIRDYYNRHAKARFILTRAKKRFAYPTLTEAQESCIARKKRYVSILKQRLHDAEQQLGVASRHLINPIPMSFSFMDEPKR